MLDCHDGDTQKGKADLEALPFRITTIAAELRRRCSMHERGEMPPEDKKQPKGAESFLADLADTMVFAAKPFRTPEAR